MPDIKDSTHIGAANQVELDQLSRFDTLSYLYPLLSLVLDAAERSLKLQQPQPNAPVGGGIGGYVKKSMHMQAQNGPRLLIVCGKRERKREREN